LYIELILQIRTMDGVNNINDLKRLAKEKLPASAYEYLVGGADDLVTLGRNQSDFHKYRIRPRRLVAVKKIDTRVTLFGTTWPSPIAIAPLGLQGLFHPDRELATAKAAAAKNHLLMVSTITHEPFERIAQVNGKNPWFQLYTTTDRSITEELIRKAEVAGAPVIALTVDVPVPGNRESHNQTFQGSVDSTLGNLAALKDPHTFFDPDLDWDFVTWLKQKTSLKIVLKGIMTAEDAQLSLEYGADGIIGSWKADSVPLNV